MNQLHRLQDLVQVARDGAAFYEYALQRVEDDRLRGLFAQMAAAKRELIDGLSGVLATSGEEAPGGGTLSGSLKQRIGQVTAALSGDRERSYILQLEQVEDRLLDHMQLAIGDTDDPVLMSLLENYLPKMRTCHDQMQALKQRTAA
ncbi:MAG TPA: PA2169 family four-helix-bundle protein [Solimonas sp.]|nr:PA2169 family four-helix-bundle protein [Solimonas sp.]